MNIKRIHVIMSIIIVIISSCNRTDFSSPEEVIKKYRDLTYKDEHDILYDLYISSKSKEFVTKDEFYKLRNVHDSLTKSIKLIKREIFGFDVDINNPTYRRFRVDEISVLKKDTTYKRFYYSLINENGKWKIIWTDTLLDFAIRKHTDGNYSEARKTLMKILEIDPFSGITYNQLAWSYYRDKSLSMTEWENGVVKNAKYAINLEKTNHLHYNILAAYYSAIGSHDLAIQNLERGLNYCPDKEQKAILYSNLVTSYVANNNYSKAEYYVKKSMKINDKEAFIWYIYGNLMQSQSKFKKAIKYFEKALEYNKMESSLQGNLYYSYAYCCFKDNRYNKALKYINMALDTDPSNKSYQRLYSLVNKCNS
jgi:tetratricopeptide (TPR) repeat protein